MTAGNDAALSRRAYAAALLGDPTRRAQVTADIAALDQTTPPKLTVITGNERLTNARHVGILAGSFNPPTLAHTQLAAQARASAQLDALIWTISSITVDKESVTRAPLVDRLLTLQALITPRLHEAVGVINRGLYGDQIAAICATLPLVQQLTFVIGFDKIVQIVDPRYYADRDAALDTLFSQAQLLVAPRNDDTATDLATLFARPENHRWADRVRFLPLDPALRDIASSQIRTRIQAGQASADIVPPESLALIDSGAYDEM